MRDLYHLPPNVVRDQSPQTLAFYGSAGDEGNGAFWTVSCIDGAPMRVVASNGGGWDHVSVSRRNRCPNWPEMEQIKRAFFKDDETAIQFHVPPVDHRNLHHFCLHLWRPNDGREIPRPPGEMVA